MKRAFPTVVLVLACGAGGWYARQYAPLLGWTDPGKQTTGAPHDGERGKGSAASENAGRESVVALGRVEPADGVIDVGGTIGDRLGRLLVEEGSSVKKGDLLAELESRQLRKLELDAADCRLHIAEQRLTVEQSLADVKIKMAELGVDKADAATRNVAVQENKIKLLAISFTLAKKDQERLADLSKELASDQERERQALLVQRAASELESARAMLRQIKLTNNFGLAAARLELAAALVAKEQLPFAVPVESLRVSRKLAAAMFDRTGITAPCEGTVLKTCVRPGETIGAGPLLQIADLRRMIVVAEVYENEVKHLRVGQQAIISSKAFAPPGDIVSSKAFAPLGDVESFRGTVLSIGRIISTPVMKNVDPFAPADRHVVDVRVELDEEGSRRAAALTHLQVDVRFLKRGEERGTRGEGTAKNNKLTFFSFPRSSVGTHCPRRSASFPATDAERRNKWVPTRSMGTRKPSPLALHPPSLVPRPPSLAPSSPCASPWLG